MSTFLCRSGTSDPVTFVECFGQKQNTSTKYGQTSCVFDELLIFNMKNLDKEAFEEGFIRIAVRDSTIIPGGKKTMIGAFAVDAMQVVPILDNLQIIQHGHDDGHVARSINPTKSTKCTASGFH